MLYSLAMRYAGSIKPDTPRTINTVKSHSTNRKVLTGTAAGNMTDSQTGWTRSINAESADYTMITGLAVDTQHYEPVEPDHDSACSMTLKYYYRRYFMTLKTL